MCGITVGLTVSSDALRHRGPDDHRVRSMGKWTLGFNRLAINDLSGAGMQPFERNGTMMVCNGEIYNHKDFENGKEESSSDCECILRMIRDYGIHDTCNLVRGVFALAWTDGNADTPRQFYAKGVMDNDTNTFPRRAQSTSKTPTR